MRPIKSENEFVIILHERFLFSGITRYLSKILLFTGTLLIDVFFRM